jgi:hypothetical protein
MLGTTERLHNLWPLEQYSAPQSWLVVMSLLSADKEGIEKLISYVRYMKNNEVRGVFLSMLTYKNATMGGNMDAAEK